MTNVNVYLLLLFLCLPVMLRAQGEIRGRVVSREGGEGIAYATIGLLRTNQGVTADEAGYFRLAGMGLQGGDSLLVTCVGFRNEKVQIPVSKTDSLIIALSKDNLLLQEIIVGPQNRTQSLELGAFSDCSRESLGSSGYQTQLAQRFEASVENAQLTRLKLCRFSIPIIKPNKTVFRIRVYDADSLTGGPSTDLCDRVIEVKTSVREVEIDLEPYRIIVPGRRFFVAIEWLKIPVNEERTKTKVDGKTTEHLSYRPGINWVEAGHGRTDLWMLDYRNRWSAMPHMKGKRALMTVSLRY